MSETPQFCKDGHDFLPGVVIAARRWLIRLEFAIFVCRRCGTIVSKGWELE